MGRIKTKRLKRQTREFIKTYPDKFNKVFDDNKKTLGDVGEIDSKKLRNIIAGYVARLKKKGEDISAE